MDTMQAPTATRPPAQNPLAAFEFNEAKTAELIAYIASRVDIGKTKLMKLLYWIDFVSYEKTGKPVTNAKYYHWTHGPVPTEVYNGLRLLADDAFEVKTIERAEYSYVKVEPLRDGNLAAFSSDEKSIVDTVLRDYGTKSTDELVDLSHRELPWKITRHREEIPYFLAFYRDGKRLGDEELLDIQENKEYIQQVISNFV